LRWRFAVCIGTGPVVAMTKRVPLLDRTLKKAFTAIASDVSADGEDPFPISSSTPSFRVHHSPYQGAL
jgi:hypothetical protein